MGACEGFARLGKWWARGGVEKEGEEREGTRVGLSPLLLTPFSALFAALCKPFPSSSPHANPPPRPAALFAQDADLDGDNLIDYEEFLACTISQSKLQREEYLRHAFEQFDHDGDGVITEQELIQVSSAGCHGRGTREDKKGPGNGKETGRRKNG